VSALANGTEGVSDSSKSGLVKNTYHTLDIPTLHCFVHNS